MENYSVKSMKCIYRIQYNNGFRIYSNLYNTITNSLIDNGIEIYKDVYYSPHGIKVKCDDIDIMNYYLHSNIPNIKFIKW
jgi:hypothetical protein